ncbi:MAG: hypothetical protein Q7N95_10300 [Alphaproteobacteria bacterium]|nr:hypothetical protein [Alphaproteobacteria bacterium]
MTKLNVEAGEQLKTAVHDHVVVGRGKTVSLQQLGLI